MKASINWLKDYVHIDMSPDELARVLTMIGLEVEGIEAVGQSLEEIVVARIEVLEPHPEADRLYLCQVDMGSEVVQVVCSAPNLKVGTVMPLALPGAVLPGGRIVREDRIRGAISQGMLLAEDEMGLTDDHTGVMVLSPDLAPGTPLNSVVSLPDWVLDLGITPNRPDCASILGIAREIAAVTGERLRRPENEIEESGPVIQDLSSVTIEDSSGCPRYAAGIVQDVELGRSPFWMRYRLFSSGIRSINTIVDVTNYVMLEMGQPLHAFDYDRLRENRIVVRRAREGEVFTTLDGETRPLNRETLMICDGERPVALAGIMGGLNSEIFPGTRHLLIESAFFDPVVIRRSSKRLGLSTEASYRFERGADIEGVTTALKRAISLISGMAGGVVATGIIDNYPVTYTSPTIPLRVDRANRLLGTSLSRDVMSGYLKSLELTVRDINENELRVQPPSFRVDIAREVDLVEEVARLSGYENVPITYPRIRPSGKGESRELLLRDSMRSVMVSLGFSEVITYSFISPDSADRLGAEKGSALQSFVRLLNPLTVEESVLRTCLIPGLLATVRANIIHDEKDLNLFEWGRIFIRSEGAQQPEERLSLAAAMSGLCQRQSWYADERQIDFYDAKGSVEALLKGIGMQGVRFQKGADFARYDEEFSASIYCGDSLIGLVGRVSPAVMQAYALEKENVYIFEFDMETIIQGLSAERKFQPLSRFPAVYRDISMIFHRQLETAKILEIIEEEGGELVEAATVFDLYEGTGMGSSERALSFKVCYRSTQKTLDGGEVNELHESIIDRISRETGGRLREG